MSTGRGIIRARSQSAGHLTAVLIAVTCLALPAALFAEPFSISDTNHQTQDSKSILKQGRAALEAGDTSKAVSIFARLPEKDGEGHFDAGAMLVEHKAYAPAAKEFGLARKTYKDPYLAGYDEALA